MNMSLHSNKADTFALLVLESLCFIYLHTAQLEQARQIAQLLVQGSTRSGIAFMRSTGDWFLGIVYYQINELETAAQYFSQIVENRYTAQVTTYRDAIAGLALINQILGESAPAWQMMEAISQFDLEQRGSEEPRTRSLRARLLLMQGNLESAGRWVDTFSDLPPDQPLLWLEEPQVTRVRVLVARGGRPTCTWQTQYWTFWMRLPRRTHNIRYKIEILALRALALDAVELRTQSKSGAAIAALRQAVDLALPGGFIRVFVDLGKSMQAMLRRLAKQGYSVEKINHILVAFPKDESILVEHPPGLSHGISPLTGPLTPRELEILQLLRGPLSIKEIANIPEYILRDG